MEQRRDAVEYTLDRVFSGLELSSLAEERLFWRSAVEPIHRPGLDGGLLSSTRLYAFFRRLDAEYGCGGILQRSAVEPCQHRAPGGCAPESTAARGRSRLVAVEPPDLS
jgi:hypothetical protein